MDVSSRSKPRVHDVGGILLVEDHQPLDRHVATEPGTARHHRADERVVEHALAAAGFAVNEADPSAREEVAGDPAGRRRRCAEVKRRPPRRLGHSASSAGGLGVNLLPGQQDSGGLIGHALGVGLVRQRDARVYVGNVCECVFVSRGVGAGLPTRNRLVARQSIS